jgi:glycosyltransferase involved in cell wall biosynthesis
VTIVYFGVVDWHYLRQRPQQLARGLARHATVVYAHPRAFLGPLRARRHLPPGALTAWRTDPEGEGRALHLFQPLGPPRHRGAFLKALADRLFLRGLVTGLERHRLVPDLVWIGHPSHAAWRSAFPGVPVLYDCMDHWGAFPGAGDAALIERRLVAEAAWVLASSGALASRLEAMGARVHLVPNGVEHARFRAAVDAFAAAPRTPGRRTALTVGTFGSWVDFELIAGIAAACPEWRFRLAGPVEAAPPGGLPEAPNLEWLGRVPYEALPDLMAQADAAFLPFRLDELTASVDPVKVYEFLAAGLPVAAVPLPELAKFAEGVFPARTAGAFRGALEAARQLGASEAGRRSLSDAVAVHSWQARADNLAGILAAGAAAGADRPPGGSESRGDHLVS